MRTVDSAVTTAIGLKSRNMIARATFTKMRAYFTSLSSNNPPATTFLPVLPENSNDMTIHPSACTRSGSYTYTVFRDETELKGLRHDSATANSITYGGQKVLCAGRPGLTGDTVFWKDIGPYTSLYTGTITWSTWATTRTLVATLGAGFENAQGHCIPMSSTMLAYVYVSQAGIGVKIFHNSGTWHEETTYDNAIMFPTKTLNTMSLWINHTAAVNLGGSTSPTIVYVTSPEDGSVIAVKYDPNTGLWSDPWIALQSDLSEFRCCDAFYYNSKVLLLGQFARNGEEIKHDPVPMLLTSTDGIYMAIDQYKLISKLGYRFMGYLSSNILYLSDMNRVASVTLQAAHFNSSATNTLTYDVIAFSASSSMGGAEASIALKAGDEVLINDTNIAKMNRCMVEISYHPAVDDIWTQYDTYIINDVAVVYADGVRQLQISMVQEAFWRLGTQTPPYYTEIIGKNGVIDAMKDYSNMFVSGGASKMFSTFTVDFWGAESWSLDGTYTGIDIITGGGVGAMHHSAGGKESFRTLDIISKLACTDYPVITTQIVTAKVYGWARARLGTTGKNVVTLSLGVFLDRDGKEVYVPCTLSSTYAKWPKTYPDAGSGSDPITFVLGTSLGGADIIIGDKIKRFGVMIDGADDCCWRIERITIDSGISVGYTKNEWTQMKIMPPSAALAGGFELPGYGRYVMLSSKPYSAFGSITMATFNNEQGSTPTTSSAGISGFGIVILAEDANNCILVRMQANPHPSDSLSNKIRIIKVRDGIETLLATSSSSYSTRTNMAMLVVHKGRSIKVYEKNYDGSTYNPAVSYDWVAARGPMATAKEEYLHNGVYLEKSPPCFRIPGFNIKSANAIPLLVGDDLTGFNGLSASGYVVIDGRKYYYGSKSGTTYGLGPYKLMSAYTRGAYNNGYSYPAADWYDVGYYYNLANSSQYARYAGYVISSDTGFAVPINYDDFQPGIVDSWDNGPGNRSAHGETGELGLQYLQTSNRMYIGPGLKSVVRSYGEEDMTHGWGAIAYQYATEIYQCRLFTSFSAANEMTVRDIVDIISRTVGVYPQFSGDVVSSSISLSAGTPYQIY